MHADLKLGLWSQTVRSDSGPMSTGGVNCTQENE